MYVCVYVLKHLRNPWVDFLHSGEDFQQVPQYNLTYFLMSIYRKHLYYNSGSPLFVCLCVSDILRDGWAVLILVWGKDRCYIWLTSLSLFYDLLRKFKVTRCHWLYLLICFNVIEWPVISTSYCQIPQIWHERIWGPDVLILGYEFLHEAKVHCHGWLKFSLFKGL